MKNGTDNWKLNLTCLIFPSLRLHLATPILAAEEHSWGQRTFPLSSCSFKADSYSFKPCSYSSLNSICCPYCTQMSGTWGGARDWASWSGRERERKSEVESESVCVSERKGVRLTKRERVSVWEREGEGVWQRDGVCDKVCGREIFSL